jgi:hypothetical protein
MVAREHAACFLILKCPAKAAEEQWQLLPATSWWTQVFLTLYVWCCRYDGTVRNSAGDVVQFLYGEDGMDAVRIEGQVRGAAVCGAHVYVLGRTAAVHLWWLLFKQGQDGLSRHCGVAQPQ